MINFHKDPLCLVRYMVTASVRMDVPLSLFRLLEVKQ